MGAIDSRHAHLRENIEGRGRIRVNQKEWLEIKEIKEKLFYDN